MTDERLKSYADRVDRLEEERKAISGDIRDVMTEVKSAGYNPKALRKVLAERRAGTDEAFESELDAYRAALGVASYRAVAEKFGIPKSTLHRRVPRVENGTLDHDADGVIHETTPATGVRPSFPAAAEQAPVQKGRTAGSSAASIHGPRLEGGPSRAAADCGASPEPAAVTPAVNADPPSGVYPRDSSGQGSEVGTYSTSCGAMASASATHNSHPVGQAEGAVAAPAVVPHDTKSRSLEIAVPAAAGAADVSTRKDDRSGERDTRTWDEIVGKMPAGLRGTV